MQPKQCDEKIVVTNKNITKKILWQRKFKKKCVTQKLWRFVWENLQKKPETKTVYKILKN